MPNAEVEGDSSRPFKTIQPMILSSLDSFSAMWLEKIDNMRRQISILSVFEQLPLLTYT